MRSPRPARSSTETAGVGVMHRRDCAGTPTCPRSLQWPPGRKTAAATLTSRPKRSPPLSELSIQMPC